MTFISSMHMAPRVGIAWLSMEIFTFLWLWLCEGNWPLKRTAHLVKIDDRILLQGTNRLSKEMDKT